MLKKTGLLIFLAALVLALYHPHPAGAGQVILDDKFQNTDYVDTGKTTAYVDTAGGYVCLPQQPMPDAIAMKQFGYEYAIATAGGINVYSYDDATGKMALNPALSVPSVTNAIGVAVRQDTPDIWALTSNSLTLYKFNGSQMATNPNLQVTGLNNVLSVSSWSNADKAAVLSKSGTVTVYDASGGSLAPSVTFSTGLTNPVAVSVMPGTPDMVVATANAFYYYVYNDATGNYVQDSTRTVTGLTGTLSVSGQQTGTAVLNNSGVNYYLQNDAGGYKSVAALSASPISSPVALSIKLGSYDYAVLTRSGVKYYTYDDAAGMVVENPALEVSGLNLVSLGYLHPKDYYSVVVNTESNYDNVLLTVNQTLPPGTSVDWYISSDGGLNWAAVTPGSWATIESGNQFVVHAVLDTSDSNVTPKIFEVKLEVKALTGITLSPTSLSVIGVNKFIGSLAVTANYSDGSTQDVTNLVAWNVAQYPTLVQSGAVVAYVSGPGQVFSGPYVGTAIITAVYSISNGQSFTSNPCTVTVNPDIPPSGISNFVQNYRREV
ncbi:hypothetical protein GFC01_01960 [Desulfofundulus thermobenzoicus]|uniref:BIG2 domain-containing protein n=1 Tax=Desulfofundulus thermobenzoicus TaxID=29376 RepID=A0A6N7IN30_9FIRM|nr:hypothetical protein [Desulfofundulus thermobenzoicus]MQL51053.1 hypothetical protein [Desulfofundulus thermobenzoicus]